jgi:hypothetical protein
VRIVFGDHRDVTEAEVEARHDVELFAHRTALVKPDQKSSGLVAIRSESGAGEAAGVWWAVAIRTTARTRTAERRNMGLLSTRGTIGVGREQ